MENLSGKRYITMIRKMLGHFLKVDVSKHIPDFNGKDLSGLRGRLEFIRDQNGVAHVYAEHESDLYLGVGYLQGKERFVLLDLLRHLGSGRLCELLLDVKIPEQMEKFGGMQVSDIDSFVLPLGFEAQAKRDLYRLSPGLQQNLKAFATGINSALKAMAGVYPPEFLVLGEVKPWRPEDCLLLARTSALVVSLVPLENELTFDNVRAQEGDEIARLLYPDAPWENAPEIAPGGGEKIPDGPIDPPNMGSNNWAISGARSKSGKPIVCNDPHVPLIPGPTYWQHVHLECKQYSVQGGIFPGFPAMGYGHNQSIAWGVTTAFRDAWDVFRIHRVPARQSAYKTCNGLAEIQQHSAELKPRFQKPKKITWETCEHGVIYANWRHHDGTSLAIKYAECDLAVFYQGHNQLMAADTVAETQAALANVNQGPFDFNLVYGHKDGHIAWESVGLLPKRNKDGLFIRDAQDPDAQWHGYLSFAQNPKKINPEQGFVVTANASTCDDQFPKIATKVHCEEKYRQHRIEKLIQAKAKHDWQSMAEIQRDIFAEYAIPLKVRILQALEKQSVGARLENAFNYLKEWDGCFNVESVGATIFYFTRYKLSKLVFKEILGTESGKRFMHGQRALPRLDRLLKDSADPLHQWLRQNTQYDLDYFIWLAFEKTALKLSKVVGESASQWQWGKLHRVRIGGIIAEIPKLGEPWVVIDKYWPGETNTVSPSVSIPDRQGLRSFVGASSRFICDLANPREAWFAHSTGPSVDPRSPFFRKVAEQWARFEYFKSGLWQPCEVPNPVEHVVMHPEMEKNIG